MPNDDWVMGALAAQDQYRPLGNDPWTNTMRGTASAPGQGFAVSADPVLYPTASPLVNITEGDIKRATEVGLAASGGGIKGQQIKAYHSSPHDFDKFDLAKIGTGEGAQSYGHGVYLATNPAVSGQGGQYWKQFLRRFGDPEVQAAKRLERAGFDRDKATALTQGHIDAALKRAQGSPGDFSRAAVDDYLAQLNILKGDKPVGPRTYEVNIKADPAHMLDWDKPLRRQSPEVVEGLQKAMRPSQWKEFNPADAGVAMNQGFIGLDKRIASEKLAEAGIPGIKYLDEKSRGRAVDFTAAERQIAQGGNKIASADEWRAELARLKQNPLTSNYVIFDPSIIDIMKKYGIAGAAPAGMGALAAQDTYRGDR